MLDAVRGVEARLRGDAGDVQEPVRAVQHVGDVKRRLGRVVPVEDVDLGGVGDLVAEEGQADLPPAAVGPGVLVCSGRKPPFLAVKRPARPYKGTI